MNPKNELNRLVQNDNKLNNTNLMRANIIPNIKAVNNVPDLKIQTQVVKKEQFTSSDGEFLKEEFIRIRNKVEDLERQAKSLRSGDILMTMPAQSSNTKKPSLSPVKDDSKFSYPFIVTVMFFFTCTIAGLMTIRKIYIKQTSNKDN